MSGCSEGDEMSLVDRINEEEEEEKDESERRWLWMKDEIVGGELQVFGWGNKTLEQCQTKPKTPKV